MADCINSVNLSGVCHARCMAPDPVQALHDDIAEAVEYRRIVRIAVKHRDSPTNRELLTEAEAQLDRLLDRFTELKSVSTEQ